MKLILIAFLIQISTKYHECREELPPHVYAVAERAYRRLVTESSSQCCVISGESGSGKTETSKFLVQHLSRISGSEEGNLNSKINQVINMGVTLTAN